MDMLPLAEMTI